MPSSCRRTITNTPAACRSWFDLLFLPALLLAPIFLRLAEVARTWLPQ